MEILTSTLAKLFSAENIDIQITDGTTAAFDTQKRVMWLPMWITKLNSASKELLLLHEASHALHTPELGKHEVVKFKKDSLFATIYNIVEDKRIEDLMKEKFPGSVSTFNRGFFELVNQNFFGISFDQDPDELNFLDRANLHFKGSYYFPCNFDEEEQYWIERIEQSKTTEQVEQTVNDILEWLKEKFTDEIFDTFVANYNSDDFSDELDENDIFLSFTGEQLESLQEMFDSNDMEGIKDFIKSEFNNEDSPFFQDLIQRCESITEQNWENKIEQLKCEHDEFDGDIKTVNLFRDFEYKPFIVDNQTVHEHLLKMKNVLTSSQHEILEQYITDFKTNTKYTLQHMLREFFRKKAAEEYRRTKFSKTGNLNLNRLSYYKSDDDIFLHKAIQHTEKNHAFVMLFDWSGSMMDRMESALTQLLINVSFCKNAGIPFVVYAFTKKWGIQREIFIEYPKKGYITYQPESDLYSQRENGIVIDPKLKLMELINSQSNNYETQLNNILMLSIFFSKRRISFFDNSKLMKLFKRFGLSFTPLDESMILMYYAMFDLKRRLNSDIINLVVMTDGYSDQMKGYAKSNFDVDHNLTKTENAIKFHDNIQHFDQFLIQVERSRNIYDMRCSDKMEITAKLSKIIKKEHNINTVCIQLTEMSKDSLILRIERQFNLDYETAKKYAEYYHQKMHVNVSSDGFDRLIYMNSKLFSEDTSDPDEYLDKLKKTKKGIYTVKQLTGAMVRSSKVKKRKKVFINSFIEIISEKQ